MCANIGNKEAENEFLDTTYCYVKKGDGNEEITLREYFEKHVPKSNPKTGANGDVLDHQTPDEKAVLRSKTKSFPSR